MKAGRGLSMFLGVLAGCGSSSGAHEVLDVGNDATGGPSFSSDDAGGIRPLDAAIEQGGVTVKLITLSCAGSCATVQAVGIGGAPPYTYAWENRSTNPVRKVCPTAKTAYSVKVTDTGTTGELAQPAQTAEASVTAQVIECPDGGDAGATSCDSLAKVSPTHANPSGAWSYGSSQALGGAFSLYTQSLASPATFTGFDMWTSGVAGLYPPCAYFNPSSSPITDSTFTAQPGQFMLHPGPAGQYSVARWTAPAAGRYVVHASFEGVDQGPTTTDVHVQHNGADIAGGSINVNGTGDTFDASPVIEVNAGDTIDFAVGFGNGNYLDDSTAVDAVVCPQPSPDGG